MRALIAGLFIGCMAFAGARPGMAEWKPSEVTMNPAELESEVAAAGRPRLFLQDGGLERLKEAIRTTHRARWERLKAEVEESLDRDPPEYRPPKVGNDPTRPGTVNDEMLWQRQFGYRLPGMALVALLDPDPKYFEATRKWALKPGEYPLWGAGVFEGADLAAAHELFGIAIAYDWLYDRWSPEDRERLRTILAEHGQVMYEAAEGINDRGWWKQDWRQNHSWCNYQGLGVAAIALAGDVPGAGTWLAKSAWGFQHIVAELPDEGAYEEGVPYWGYGMESLIRFVAAAQPYVPEDYYGAEYLRNTHLFRMYMAGPQMWQCPNFGDGPPRDWHAIRPLMYRLASQYADPRTQWLAEHLPDRDEIDSLCWTLLWEDAGLDAAPPDDLPVWHVFKHTGFASARTGWEEDALTLHLRSGRAAVSHSHLDVNNFLLNAGGEWLLRDYGYGKVGPGYFNREVAYFSNATAAHNCLVIGEKDQRTDDDSVGTITDAEERGGVVWFRSDATKTYEGAESVVRELALVLPHGETGKWGYVVVRDRAKAAAPETFDFMLNPGGEATVEGDGFTIQGEHSRLVGKVLAPTGVTIEVLPGIGEHINVDDPRCVRIRAPQKASEVEFVVVLVPLAEGEDAPEIGALGAGAAGARVGADRIVFSTDGREPPRREAGQG
jgi:hypothetical protein